jgi:hypothetical protein
MATKQDMQFMYKRNINHCCRRRARRFTHSECVAVALAVQHAERMRIIILASVACPALPYYFHIIRKTARFSGEKIYTLHLAVC